MIDLELNCKECNAIIELPIDDIDFESFGLDTLDKDNIEKLWQKNNELRKALCKCYAKFENEIKQENFHKEQAELRDRAKRNGYKWIGHPGQTEGLRKIDWEKIAEQTSMSGPNERHSESGLHYNKETGLMTNYFDQYGGGGASYLFKTKRECLEAYVKIKYLEKLKKEKEE